MDLQQKKQRINKYKKANLRITREIRDIIHGYVMSDGYVRKDGVLTVDQSKKQATFAEWIGQKLKDLRTPTSTIADVQRTHGQTSKNSQSKRFNTRALLIGFHTIWYKLSTNAKGNTQYKKALPKNIRCFFSPWFITVWFAGDGTKVDNARGAKFEVTSFSPQERLILKQLFMQKYGIDAHINKAGISRTGNQQWTLNILEKDYDTFRSIITKYDLIERIFPHKLCKKK